MIKTSESRGTRGVVTAATLIGVVAVLYLAREILIPLAFAITLTLVLAPTVTWLHRHGVGRFPASLMVMIIAMAAAGWVGWVIFNQLVEVVNDLPSYQQNIHNKLQAMRAPGKGALGRAAASVKELGQELSAPNTPAAAASNTSKRGAPPPSARPMPVQIVAEPANEYESIRDVVKPVLAPLGMLAVVLIFTMFLLIEQNDLRNRLFRLAGIDRLNVMTQALDDATQRVSRYLMLQLMVNAVFGTLCGVGLYFIGVPYAALWGAVAGILRSGPYAGSMVSTALPVLLSLAVFDSWMRPVLVFVLMAGLEVVTGNLVEPWLYGMHTGISSLALLLTTVFWAVLWGPSGLILATPLTVCVVVLGRHVPHLSFLHILLGDQPVLSPEAQVYQRLLAMDDHDARTVAGLYLGENSLVQLYDSVIIPALSLAEQDRHKGALEPEREEYIFLGIKEMISELSQKHEAETEGQPKPVPEKRLGRVICLAANDEADEIAAAMLAQLLVQAGCAAITLPADPALHHVVAIVGPGDEDVFCISAVPPFAFSHARALSTVLEGRFPKTKIVVGVWGFSGDTERALQRFQPARPSRLVTTLAGRGGILCGVT